MINTIKKCLAIAAFAFMGCKSSPPVAIVPVETFFKDAQRTDYRISPNGESIAFLQTVNGKQNLFVRSVIDSAATQITNLTDVSIKNYQWTGNQKLFCIKQKDSLNGFGAFIIAKNGKQLINIKTKPGTQADIIERIN